MNEHSAEEHWYAYKVLYNSMERIKQLAAQDNLRYFVPMRTIVKPDDCTVARSSEPIIPSLIFIRSQVDRVELIRRNSGYRAGVYCYPGTTTPARIPDREMEIFMFVTATGCKSLEAIDEKLLKGDRVRITAGVFEGAEGYIARIHGTKRFVVAIEGVAAIATVFIPKRFIEKLSDKAVLA